MRSIRWSAWDRFWSITFGWRRRLWPTAPRESPRPAEVRDKMKLRRGRAYRRGRIEIIPMIDVMFFLLVTFMLASLSMQSLNSISVNLPQGDAPNLEHKEPVTLTITKDSRIFLDKTPTTLAAMAFALKLMLTEHDAGV